MSPRAWLRRQSLTRRLWVAFGALGVVVGLLVAVFLVSGLRAASEQDLVTNRMFDAVLQSSMRFQAVLDQETGVRGFALNPDDRDQLVPYDEGIASQRASSAAVDRLLADQPELLAASHRVDDAVAAWRRTYAEPVIVARGAVGATTTDAGKRLFDEVREANDAYSAAVLAARTRSVERLDSTSRVVLGVLVAGVALAALAFVALAVALRRWVTEPIARLGHEARVVRRGDLDHAVRVDSPPELSALARDIDLMRLGLVEQIYEVDKARQLVEDAQQVLVEQAAELERSNRDLEQFAYVASHDLQEPLRKVASFCQLLERRYAGELDERADQYIAYAVDGAKRMQALINDLLAFSRVGRISAGRTAVDLQVCLHHVVRNLDVIIQETGAVVTNDALPTVWGESPLLTTLLQNLVGNAIKFHGADPPHVHVGCRRAEDDWELSCSDNGIGIEPQYADRIFVIFQRLHARDDYEGTGIGLAMAKKIVEYHGGTIWLDTDVAAGTTFRWTLPALDRSPAGDAPVAGTAAATDVRTPPEGALHV